MTIAVSDLDRSTVKLVLLLLLSFTSTACADCPYSKACGSRSGGSGGWRSATSAGYVPSKDCPGPNHIFPRHTYYMCTLSVGSQRYMLPTQTASRRSVYSCMNNAAFEMCALNLHGRSKVASTSCQHHRKSVQLATLEPNNSHWRRNAIQIEGTLRTMPHIVVVGECLHSCIDCARSHISPI